MKLRSFYGRYNFHWNVSIHDKMKKPQKVFNKHREMSDNSVCQLNSALRCEQNLIANNNGFYSYESLSELSDSGYSISDSERNQMIEDAQSAIKASNSAENLSALELYRHTNGYWNKYPKTDWTYSLNSRCRVELAPGIIAMPNMSRRTIRTLNSSNGNFFLGHNQHDNTFNMQNIGQSRKVYSNSGSLSYASWHQRLNTTSQRTFCSKPVLFLYNMVTFVLVTIGKYLHQFSSCIMLMDTRLLCRSNTTKKLSHIVFLAVLPPLLFLAWIIISAFGANVYNYTRIMESFPSWNRLLSSSVSFNHPVRKDDSHLMQSVKEDFRKNRNYGDFSHVYNEISELKLSLNKIVSQQSHQLDLGFNGGKYVPQQNQLLMNKDPTNCESCLGVLPQVAHYNKLFSMRSAIKADINRMNRIIFELKLQFDSMKADMEEMKVNYQRECATNIKSCAFLPNNVEQMIENGLAKYDADRTGLPDYAMEAMGAQILSTRCTEPYKNGSIIHTLLGWRIWSSSISPTVAITPGTQPGDCWAFQNFPGVLVIQLASTIHVEAFSMEHVSKKLIPNGRINSAPRQFQVLGLRSLDDEMPIVLGDYVYSSDGPPLQYFVAEKPNLPFNIVELRIQSNQGNPSYTCLYRFRVHGRLT